MKAGVRIALLFGLLWLIIALLSVFLFTASRIEAAEVRPFPPAGIDQFTSIFNADIEILVGPLAGQTFKLTNVTDPAQTVVRSDPFFDGGPGVDDISTFPVMPLGSTLPSVVRDSDIPVLPEGFNGTFAESVHLQMTSLNAISEDGQFRIVAGQPLKDEFPNVEFHPSFGIAVSVGESGFPARSIFIPYALVVTPFGNLVSNAPGFERAIWADVPINSFPQEGGAFTDEGPALLVPADDLEGPPVAQMTNLVHTVIVGVGGITEVLVGGTDSPASAVDDSGSSAGLYAAIAGAAAAAVALVTAGGWYVRRRW